VKRIGVIADAWGSGRLDVFGVGLDNAVYHKAWAGDWQPPGGAWQSLGGPAASNPAVVSWSPNRLDVFMVGNGRELMHKYWDGANWGPAAGWEQLGGVLTSPPAVVAWGPNRLDIFALGTDRQLFHKWWDGSAWGPSQTGWEPLGGILIGPPAVVSSDPSRLDVFALGTDRQMWWKRWDGAGWKPSPTDWWALGGTFRSMPAAASWGPGRRDLFGVGADGQMLHKAFEAQRTSFSTDRWPPAGYWEELGGAFTSRPSVVCWGPDRLDVIAVGNDAGMWHKSWDGDWRPSAKGWESLGGVFTSAPDAVAWGSGRLDVFGLGSDAQMYHRWWEGSWGGGWEPLGGIFRLPPPVPVMPPAQESRWAVLMCKFRDMPDEPLGKLHYSRLFTAAGSGLYNLVDFFHAASNDTVDISRSDVFGWLTLDHDRSEYVGSGANPAGRDELLMWGRDAAARAGIDLSPYANVVVTTNVQSDLFGGGAGVVCDLFGLDPSLLAQELGHGFGLNHSRRDGSTDDYQDPWDVMSTANAFMQPMPPFGQVGPGLNAANMRARGWLEEAAVWRLPSGVTDTTIALTPLHRRDLPGARVAELPGGYLAEFRLPEGWDAAIPEAVVLVHRLDAGYSYSMRSTAGEAAMRVGAVFEAPVGGSRLRMTVQRIDPAAHSASIRIQYPA
jgi:hypothetical protein